MLKIKLFVVLMLIVFLAGCAGTIRDTSVEYTATMEALKESATDISESWLFGSGVIQGSLDGVKQAEWIMEELKIIDAWFVDKDGNVREGITLNDFQLGYLVGKQIRLTGPVLQVTIAYYAPQILSSPGVIAILGILGGF